LKACAPGVVVAQLAASDANTAGVVLNPTAAGAGQPLEGPSLAALGCGFVGRLQF